MDWPPDRIVCPTGETVATPGLPGQDHRIARVTGHAERPAQLQREAPRACALAPAAGAGMRPWTPDLVPAFGDLRGDLAAVPVGEGRAAPVPAAARSLA